MAATPLSTLATFDDIRRCINVLTDGVAEEEFLRVLKLQDRFRQEWLSTSQEMQRIQKELDASLQSMADLETKLFHARRLLEAESKARREAEYDRDQMEKKIVAVADLLQHERNLKDETKDKLAFLNTLPKKKRKSNPHVEQKYGDDINSTGSFLLDLSLTQSEDDFLDVGSSRGWKKHRPSLPKNSVPYIGGKRSRLSAGANTVPSTPAVTTSTRRSTTRRSGLGLNQHTLDIPPGSERICATTKVTIPPDGNGAILAESTIESIPVTARQEVSATPRRSFREATAPPMTPNKPPTPKKNGSASQVRPTILRQHNFASKTFLSVDSCMQCQKKIRFGSVGLRCKDCPVRCHVDCRYLLTTSCVPQSGTPTLKGLMGYISDYAPAIPPMVPALIVHCVNEIEARGLCEVGMYRVSGSEREVKVLKERFLKGKTVPNLSGIDVHVLCGCIKDFLRSLREPLIPIGLWKDFCNAVQSLTDEDIQKDLYKAINALPQANRDTLAFLILHFQRVSECREVLMPIENMARVFGPTIVGYSSADPDQHAIFTEVYTQYNVMLNLLKISSDYWGQYIEVDANKENVRSNENFVTQTPIQKESTYSIYATPLKSTIKKRRFYTPNPYSHHK